MSLSTGDVAETVAKCRQWSARQASNPLFCDIVGLDIGEITLTINLPGLQRFRLTVEEIEPGTE